MGEMLTRKGKRTAIAYAEAFLEWLLEYWPQTTDAHSDRIGVDAIGFFLRLVDSFRSLLRTKYMMADDLIDNSKEAFDESFMLHRVFIPLVKAMNQIISEGRGFKGDDGALREIGVFLHTMARKLYNMLLSSTNEVAITTILGSLDAFCAFRVEHNGILIDIGASIVEDYTQGLIERMYRKKIIGRLMEILKKHGYKDKGKK
jgi:hypothetical protein